MNVDIGIVTHDGVNFLLNAVIENVTIMMWSIESKDKRGNLDKSNTLTHEWKNRIFVCTDSATRNTILNVYTKAVSMAGSMIRFEFEVRVTLDLKFSLKMQEAVSEMTMKSGLISIKCAAIFWLIVT